MISEVLLVFYPDGRLYFSTQAPEALNNPAEWDRWRRFGYRVVVVEVAVPV